MLAPGELGIYRLCEIDPENKQHWISYTTAVLIFSLAGILPRYACGRIQGSLPFNPQKPSGAKTDLPSRVTTNTDWQNDVGETTMSNLVWLCEYADQNFGSAADGNALAIA